LLVARVYPQRVFFPFSPASLRFFPLRQASCPLVFFLQPPSFEGEAF